MFMMLNYFCGTLAHCFDECILNVKTYMFFFQIITCVEFTECNVTFCMQMQTLRRELSSGVRPLHETFVALVRVFAKKGLSTRAMEILAAMERYKYDIRKAWLVLVGMEIGLP